jgi:prepilin-type N-terminal cleavage/methylation domain-containing protein
MKTKSAFTIVELLVVVSIITILSAVTIFAYSGSQKDARDSARKGTATVISEALEKYYDKNGEYPSVVSLVNSSVSGQAAADKLGVALDDLGMPRLPAGTTNPLTSTNPPTNDNITYIATSDVNNTSCQTSPTGGCDQFTLKYIEESGQTITIASRRHGRPSSTPTTPDM